MADAQVVAVYEQFCATPLQLRSKTSSSPTPSSIPRLVEDESVCVTSRVTRSRRAKRTVILDDTDMEVDLLHHRIDVECHVDDDGVLTVGTVPSKSTRTRATRSSKDVETTATSETTTAVVNTKKTKRVTREVAMVKADTAGVIVDTPTSVAARAKRRKTSDTSTKRTSRNIMDEMAEVHEEPTVTKEPLETAAQSKRGRSNKPQVGGEKSVRRSSRRRNLKLETSDDPVGETETEDQSVASSLESDPSVVKDNTVLSDPIIDVSVEFCEPLLLHHTTSGMLFAMWFAALEKKLGLVDGETDAIIATLRLIFAVCEGISQCEAMAQAHSLHDRHSDESPRPQSTKKKAVRFRHFDLSSLDLNYIDDSSATRLVEDLLSQYTVVVDNFNELWERWHHSNHKHIIQGFLDVLQSLDELIATTLTSTIAAVAFRGLATVDQAEVWHSRGLFAREFAKLSQNRVTAPAFLDEIMSPLCSSLVRFRLRLIFLPFDPAGLVDDGEAFEIATYEHQDFGAAIHRGLLELLTLRSVVTPILKVIAANSTTDTDKRQQLIQDAIRDVGDEHMESFDRYIIVSRFVHLSFSRCILEDSAEDEEIAMIKADLERLCALAKRLQFDDEAHLFPIASINKFATDLEKQEPALAMLDLALQSMKRPQYDTVTPCVECNEMVTQAQDGQSITCVSCCGRFHLQCLHLPPSFKQFASQYTCPFCYIGRSR